MKGKRVWLLLAVMVLSSYLNLSAYADKVSDQICSNDTIKGIRYDESVGYYLEKEIPHGLEFEIIGKEADKNEFVTHSMNKKSALDNFFDPTTSISEQVGTITISGVWWGGIVTGLLNDPAVASVTIAQTDNTQGKASIKPGINANWMTSGWKNKNVRADVAERAGLAGNKATWDLRLIFN